MKTIRCGVFETNSSSTHSFTLSSEVKYNIPMKIELHNILLDDLYLPMTLDDEYGWSYETFTNWKSKLEYIILSNLGNIFRLKLISDVIFEEIGVKILINPTPLGYVDHQSDDITDELFVGFGDYSDYNNYSYDVMELKRKIVLDKIKQFIFDENTVLITDNDNH